MIVDSPCIGICSSVYGDAICRGCKRSAQEVIDWNAYPLSQKQAVYDRLTAQISAILLNYIEIVNESLLAEKIALLKIRLRPHALPIEHAFHLLRLGADKMKNIENYGLKVKAEFQHLPLTVLFNQIDSELYATAQHEK